MNVLVIAPHPDDETIGCGGTLLLHHKRGDRIFAVYLTSGELGLKHLVRTEARRMREREAERAAKILGIRRRFFLRLPDWFVGNNLAEGAAKLASVLKQTRPALVYLPHPADGHPDHQAALPLMRLAVQRNRLPVPAVRAYEVWTPLAQYDHVEDVTRVMRRKIRALRAHRSQSVEFDYEQAMCGLNQFRGALAAKCRYAEVFQSIESTGGDE